MPHIFPTSATETISEEIEDYYSAFNNALGWSAQSAETLQNALQRTDWRRRFVVYEHDQAVVVFFTIYGWKQKVIFLRIISIFCVYDWTGIVQISGWFLHSLPKQTLALDVIFMTVSQYHFCPLVPL